MEINIVYELADAETYQVISGKGLIVFMKSLSLCVVLTGIQRTVLNKINILTVINSVQLTLTLIHWM